MNSVPAPADLDPVNLLDFDRTGLAAYLVEIGEKPFRASQLLKWIYQESVDDFDGMTNLGKALRAYLKAHCRMALPEVVAEQIAGDGTRKWAMQTECGNRVETVFIPEAGRGTLCVSSQIGCALACTFCSTAQQGFNRNLKTSEIIGQVLAAQKRLGTSGKITNVVMMGMGEPLLNFDNVVKAMRLMMDDFAFGLSKRRVTISTSGVVPAIYRLTQAIDVSLAVSLHAVTNELRDQLVPINQKYPLGELLEACRDNAKLAPRRTITFEYVMLAGVNDSMQDAQGLIDLLRTVPSKLNLIPFNPFPGSAYRCSSNNAIHRFKTLLNDAGIVTTVRKTRGDDIDAACGQLVGQVADKSRRHLKLKLMETIRAA